MAKGFLAWALALVTLGSLAAGCDIFSPQSSKSTIEVSFTYTGGVCSLQANLDGGADMGVGSGSYASFPATNPGNHTVNLSTATGGSGCGGPPCAFQNNSANYSVNFNTTGGNLYVIKVAAGSSCPSLVVSGP